MYRKKLKVLIIDDESMIRELLKKCINWTNLNLELIGEASCAYEAFDLINIDIPDIILTDISMPYINGIEFSKILLNKYPYIKIIIITAYNDFSFAKKGIDIGISDFILKPIKKNEIENALIKLQEKIIKEKLHNEEYNRLKIRLKKSIPYLKEKFLNELILYNYKHDEIIEKLEFFNIKTNNYTYKTILLDIDMDNLKLVNSNSKEEALMLLKMSALDQVKNYFNNKTFINIFFDNLQRIVLICNEEIPNFENSLEVLKNILNNKFECIVNIGVGREYNNIEAIPLSYKEAIEALKYTLIYGNNQLMYYEDINILETSTSKGELSSLNSKLVDKLVFYIKAGLFNQSNEIINTIFTEAINFEQNSLENIRIIISNLVSTILNSISEVGLTINSIYENNFDPYEFIFSDVDHENLKHGLLSLIETVTKKISTVRSNKVNNIVKKSIDFINENYSNPNLTIAEIAQSLYLNPNYLSRVFKHDTGLTMIEYLKKIRMEKAIELLNNDDMKAYQVAECVGISDPHYFSICFKKYVGISISCFRKVSNSNNSV